jgi:hypothetical protein
MKQQAFLGRKTFWTSIGSNYSVTGNPISRIISRCSVAGCPISCIVNRRSVAGCPISRIVSRHSVAGCSIDIGQNSKFANDYDAIILSTAQLYLVINIQVIVFELQNSNPQSLRHSS